MNLPLLLCWIWNGLKPLQGLAQLALSRSQSKRTDRAQIWGIGGKMEEQTFPMATSERKQARPVPGLRTKPPRFCSTHSHTIDSTTSRTLS